MPFLLRGIREGLSGMEIMRALREQGLGYRLTEFYHDLRLLKGASERWDRVKYVPKDKIPSEELYVPSTLKVPSKYLTFFECEMRNRVTGEKVTKYFGVQHDVRYPVSVLEDMLHEFTEEWVRESPQYEEWDIVSAKPFKTLRRK